MEAGGHEGVRGPARPGPSFSPPAEPPGGPSAQLLALVAQILRGRELAAAAAGLPPLDSDQVLDLQRGAGNHLTTGALGRWIDAFAVTDPLTLEQALLRPPRELLELLPAARTADPAAHATIAAALDALDPAIHVRASCTAGPPRRYRIAVDGPAGGRAEVDAELAAGGAATVSIPFAAAFGPAATASPEHGLTLRIGAPDGGEASARLPLPFLAPQALAIGDARFAAFADAGDR